MITTMFFLVLLLGFTGFTLSWQKASRIGAGTPSALHSRPAYHGLYSFFCIVLSGWAILILLSIIGSAYINTTLLHDIRSALPGAPLIEHQLVLSDAKAIAQARISSSSDELRQAIATHFKSLSNVHLWLTTILTLAVATGVGYRSYSKISLEWRARNRSEKIIRTILVAMAAIAVLTTVGIVLSLVFETFSFFEKIGWRVDKFLFGTNWSPLSGVHSGAMDPDRVGAIPLFAGTFLITLIAMLVAVPVGLFSAIYLSDFAGPKTRAVVKPMLEVLAGIPTVVYGFFAAITVAPFFRTTGEAFGIQIASESALAAGVVMGIMIIPFISSLSDDVINAVPQSLRDGSYGLGATKAETIRQVVLPAALPGIVSAVLLGVSRAVGETMIVVMAAGQGANLTANPLEAVTTVTVQIVMLITGDTEASTAAGPAFSLGFTLFCLTLVMNVIAQRIVRRYRELYD